MTVPPRPKPTPEVSPTAGATAPVDAAPRRAASAERATEPSIGELVGEVSTHLSTLVRSEVELAKLELRATVKNAGVGVGLFGAAVVVLVFSLTFGFFAAAEGIAAAGLARWLAFLIVFGAQLLIVAVCVLLGIKKVKKIRGPERTIRTSKQTVAYLRDHG